MCVCVGHAVAVIFSCLVNNSSHVLKQLLLIGQRFVLVEGTAIGRLPNATSPVVEVI
jgi:hypothetical protein